MKISVNGVSHEVAEDCNLQEALTALQLALPPRSAVALNAQVIPRQNFSTTQLASGDAVLIISPTFGG